MGKKKETIRAIMPDPPKAPIGRPRKDLNEQDFEYLCSIQCSEVEIAARFSVDVDTLNAWCHRTYEKGFSDIFAIKRLLGFVSLRGSVFNSATKKQNPTMQIWLSKQYLGMTEKIETKHSITTQNMADESIHKLVQALQGLGSRN